MQCAILFDFASHWLKKWREIFQPISKRSNRTRAITFDSHLKTAQTLNARSAGPFVFIHSEEANPGGGKHPHSNSSLDSPLSFRCLLKFKRQQRK